MLADCGKSIKLRKPMLWAMCAFAIQLSSCAMQGKGILLDVEFTSSLDERDLTRQCEFGDSAACALTHASQAAIPPAKIPLFQGIAPSDRASFAALIPSSASYAWYLYDRDQSLLRKIAASHPLTRNGSAWAIQRIEIRGLEPLHNYELLTGDHEGHLLEDRNFHTLYAEEKSLRIALVAGLMNSSHEASDHLMAEVNNRRPDLIVFAGGNVDATLPAYLAKAPAKAVLDFLFERYAQSRNTDAFARNQTLVPMAATWNGAEFGQQRDGRNFLFKDQARETFKMFFPCWVDENTILSGPGISEAFELGGRLIATLDTQSFQAPIPAPLPPICEKKTKKSKRRVCHVAPAPAPISGTRFGNLQIDWLNRTAKKYDRTLYLVAGDPWFGPFSDNWAEKITAPSLNLGEIAAGGYAIIEPLQGAQLSVKELKRAY